MKMLSQMAVMRDITEDISIVHTTTLLMEHNSALKHMAQEMTQHVSVNNPIINLNFLPIFTSPTKFTVLRNLEIETKIILLQLHLKPVIVKKFSLTKRCSPG